MVVLPKIYANRIVSQRILKVMKDDLTDFESTHVTNHESNYQASNYTFSERQEYDLIKFFFDYLQCELIRIGYEEEIKQLYTDPMC